MGNSSTFGWRMPFSATLQNLLTSKCVQGELLAFIKVYCIVTLRLRPFGLTWKCICLCRLCQITAGCSHTSLLRNASEWNPIMNLAMKLNCKRRRSFESEQGTPNIITDLITRERFGKYSSLMKAGCLLRTKVVMMHSSLQCVLFYPKFRTELTLGLPCTCVVVHYHFWPQGSLNPLHHSFGNILLHLSLPPILRLLIRS